VEKRSSSEVKSVKNIERKKVKRMEDEELLNQPHMRNVIWNTLTKDNYIPVNKHLMRALGVKTAMYLSYLIFREKLWKKRNKLTDQEDFFGFFYCTQKRVEEDILLSDDQQTQCLKKLKSMGIVEVRQKGLPCRNYYRLNYSKVGELLTKYTDVDMVDNNDDLDDYNYDNEQPEQSQS
jgi:hypothetical protein